MKLKIFQKWLYRKTITYDFIFFVDTVQLDYFLGPCILRYKTSGRHLAREMEFFFNLETNKRPEDFELLKHVDATHLCPIEM